MVHHDTFVIRNLLIGVFSDEEFTSFCYDFFHSVYKSFSSGMSLNQKIQRLIDHCDRNEDFDKLLDNVQKVHPYKYEQYSTQFTTPENQSVGKTSVTQNIAVLFQLWELSQHEFLDWILGPDKNKARKNTYKAYRIALHQFFKGIWPEYHCLQEQEILERKEEISPIWPSPIPWEITPSTAQQFKEVLVKKGRSKKSKVTLDTGEVVRYEIGRTGLSKNSVNLKLAALKTFFDFLTRDFSVPIRKDYEPLINDNLLFPDKNYRIVRLWSSHQRNPFDPKVVEQFSVKSQPEYMTATEFTAIVEQINLDKVIDNRDYALLMTVWYTGCPASQVLKLRWGDIKKNFNDNYVFAYQDRAGEWNDIELPLQTYQAIRRYLQVANRLETIRQEDYIFTASDRTRIFRIPSKKNLYPNNIVPMQPLSTVTANKMIKKYARKAGVSEKKASFRAMQIGAKLKKENQQRMMSENEEITRLKAKIAELEARLNEKENKQS